MRPRLLDLCCGAGAVSIGYMQAGFDVIGVDICEQRHYPFPFIKADALSLARLLPYFDAIHASPPCLRDTVMRNAPGAKGLQHPDLITPIRAMLRASGKPYVLENVMGADLFDPIVLNGFMFDLHATLSTGQRFYLDRARKFETNWPLKALPYTSKSPVIGVYGGHVRNRSVTHGGRKTADFPGEDKRKLMCEAMGIDSIYGQSMAEMSQAVPPAYTAYIGRQLIKHLGERQHTPASV